MVKRAQAIQDGKPDVNDEAMPVSAEREDVGPRSLGRLLNIFGVLARVPNGMSLAQLSVSLEAPKSSLLNLLRPLVADGYLVLQEGTYFLGPSIILLSARVLSTWKFPGMIRPFMQELVEQTGETVLLGALNKDAEAVTFIERIDSPHPVRLQIPEGTVRPLYSSVAGRLLLAYADKEFQDQYLATVQFKLKTTTPMTRASLAREVESIRREGVAAALDVGPPAGGAGVAAPIFNAFGECIGAMTLSGPTSRFRHELELLKAQVKAAAAKASGETVDSKRPR